jgi:hypothetical protein
VVLENTAVESQERLLLVRGLSTLTAPISSKLSCFNAFSRVDIRVDVKIPGGVNAYVIDLRGERYVRTHTCVGVH